MRNKSYIVALTVILSFGLTLAWVFGAQTSGGVAASPNAELHVCPSGCQYDNVQEAVDAASEGDIIKIAEGIYTGISARDGLTQTVYLSKTLTIQGGYTTSDWNNPEPEVNITTLDAQGQGRVMTIMGGIAPTIAGLHITGGNALVMDDNHDEGGGIYTKLNNLPGDTVLTLKDNHIYGNNAWSGGGTYLDGHGAYLLEGNTFETNTASDRGGGVVIFNQVATLNNNNFNHNSCGSMGGGLAILYTDAILQNNSFTENSAGAAGGGLYVYDSAFEFDGDWIVKNSAGRGGGLAVFGAMNRHTWRDNWMVNVVVAYNEATAEGSGIYVGGCPLHLWHATLVKNIGGGDSGILIGNWNPWDIPTTSEVELLNTIVTTQTTGIAVGDGSSVEIDSILWYADAITLTEVPEADVSIVNQVTGDPAFADPPAADFHLNPTSAARDVGMDSGVANDIDGWVRPMGFGYDLGAFEHHDAALGLSAMPHLSGANIGAELTYQVVLTSSGAGDNNNVILTDTLDAWQRPIAVDLPEGNCTIENPDWGGTVICEPGNLNIGDVIDVQVTVELDADAPLGEELINSVTARADKAVNTVQSVVYAQDCHVRIGNSPTEYTSVQEAVEAAYPFALVKVAGTCMGVYGPESARQQILLEQALTLQGGYTTANWTTPDPETNITTLDARGLGRVLFINTQTPGGTLIDGLHITGGNGTYQVGGHSPFDYFGSRGGGVYVYGSDPTFSYDHIYGNFTPEEGGGMANSFCNCTIRNTTFSDNTTLTVGGGLSVHAGGTEVSDSLFEGNNAENGGGFGSAVVEVVISSAPPS